MWNKLFVLFIGLFIGGAYAGYNVCGPATGGLESSWSVIKTGVAISHWAVGTGCNGEMAHTDIENMCDDVVVGGEAFCNWDFGNSITATYEVTSSSRGGVFCWCRRTKLKQNGVVTDAVGTWIDVNGWNKCASLCAKYCAENVAAGGETRIPLLSFPAL